MGIENVSCILAKRALSEKTNSAPNVISAKLNAKLAKTLPITATNAKTKCAKSAPPASTPKTPQNTNVPPEPTLSSIKTPDVPNVSKNAPMDKEAATENVSPAKKNAKPVPIKTNVSIVKLVSAKSTENVSNLAPPENTNSKLEIASNVSNVRIAH